MDFNNSDFNADKVKQYEAVREAMAKIYAVDNPTFFGPPRVTELNKEDCQNEELRKEILRKQKQDRELIEKGCTRIQEKLKEIRQKFANAVITGSRSGSGKIILEHFDYLKQIWGGSPSTNQLPCGISSEELNDGQRSSQGQDSLYEEQNYISSEGNKSSETDITDHLTDDSHPTVVIRKRKITGNAAPRLNDNKRKHMERQLSAPQRDQLLINESKEDAQFKRDIAEAIRQSNATFAESMQQMSQSITEVAHGLTRSIEMMSQAIMQQPISSKPNFPKCRIKERHLQFINSKHSQGQTIHRCSASGIKLIKMIKIPPMKIFTEHLLKNFEF
eukprot:Seg2779.1 transcript_id=Seg2779.1/GoldUCD/mRNA.D3Y31 product="hypothetical protein" protein_id=Seg2779.1/GoldUCD/D3Y31